MKKTEFLKQMSTLYDQMTKQDIDIPYFIHEAKMLLPDQETWEIINNKFYEMGFIVFNSKFSFGAYQVSLYREPKDPDYPSFKVKITEPRNTETDFSTFIELIDSYNSPRGDYDKEDSGPEYLDLKEMDLNQVYLSQILNAFETDKKEFFRLKDLVVKDNDNWEPRSLNSVDMSFATEESLWAGIKMTLDSMEKGFFKMTEWSLF